MSWPYSFLYVCQFYPWSELPKGNKMALVTSSLTSMHSTTQSKIKHLGPRTLQCAHWFILDLFSIPKPITIVRYVRLCLLGQSQLGLKFATPWDRISLASGEAMKGCSVRHCRRYIRSTLAEPPESEAQWGLSSSERALTKGHKSCWRTCGQLWGKKSRNIFLFLNRQGRLCGTVKRALVSKSEDLDSNASFFCMILANGYHSLKLSPLL